MTKNITYIIGKNDPSELEVDSNYCDITLQGTLLTQDNYDTVEIAWGKVVGGNAQTPTQAAQHTTALKEFSSGELLFVSVELPSLQVGDVYQLFYRMNDTEAFQVVDASKTLTIVAQGTVSKTALANAITAATTAKNSVTISTDGSNVATTDKWVSQADVDTLTAAITAAQTVADKADATQSEVDAAVTTLNSAVTAFENAKKAGTSTLKTVTLEQSGGPWSMLQGNGLVALVGLVGVESVDATQITITTETENAYADEISFSAWDSSSRKGGYVSFSTWAYKKGSNTAADYAAVGTVTYKITVPVAAITAVAEGYAKPTSDLVLDFDVEVEERADDILIENLAITTAGTVTIDVEITGNAFLRNTHTYKGCFRLFDTSDTSKVVKASDVTVSVAKDTNEYTLARAVFENVDAGTYRLKIEGTVLENPVATTATAEVYSGTVNTPNSNAADPSAEVINKATISGYVGVDIEEWYNTNSGLVVRLTNDYFVDVKKGGAVSSWFNNLPDGLSAEITWVNTEVDRVMSITIGITGTPTETKDETISMTIPAANLQESQTGIDVTTSSKFDIIDATQTKVTAITFADDESANSMEVTKGTQVKFNVSGTNLLEEVYGKLDITLPDDLRGTRIIKTSEDKTTAELQMMTGGSSFAVGEEYTLYYKIFPYTWQSSGLKIVITE